jgi:ribosomal protein S9
MDINLVAPKFRAKLVKEQALVEEKRRAERRRIEQEKYTRSRQLSRRAVFTSD